MDTTEEAPELARGGSGASWEARLIVAIGLALAALLLVGQQLLEG